MTSPTNNNSKRFYFNLCDTVLTSDQFKKIKLSKVDFPDSPIIALAIDAINVPKQHSLFGQGLNRGKQFVQEMKHKTGVVTNDSIYTVSETINILADLVLAVDLNPNISLNKYLNSAQTTEEKIGIIHKSIQQLTALEKNLINHNVLVNEHNNRFERGNCENHDKFIRLAEARLQEFGDILVKLEADQAESEVIELITQLEEQVNLRFTGNRELILENYSKIMSKIDSMRIYPERKEHYKKEINTFMNRAYIVGLNIQLEENMLPFPYAVQAFFKTLGFTKEQFYQEVKKEDSELRIVLEQSLIAGDETFALIEVPDFIAAIENATAIFAEQLVANFLQFQNTQIDHEILEKRVRTIFSEATPLENKYLKIEKQQEGELRKLCVSVIEQKSLSPEKRTFMLQRINDFEFKPTLFSFMFQAMKDFDFKALAGTDEEFKNLQTKFNEVLVEQQRKIEKKQGALFAQKSSEILAFVTDLEKSKIDKWFEKNEKNRQFSFNQGEEGYSQYILQGGCCKAITYRWNRKLLQNPEMKITSVKDFDMKSPTESESSFEVYAEDRRDQALYMVGIAMDNQNTRNIGANLLKRDQLKIAYTTAEAKSITDLIAKLSMTSLK